MGIRIWALVITLIGCSKPTKEPPLLAISSVAPTATAAAASVVVSAPPAVVERPSPLASSTPIVPAAQRDAAVKLCCDMFGPYATGCVASGTVCQGALESYCREAWKRGAHLSDVEPGLRQLAVKHSYFVPKPCLPAQP